MSNRRRETATDRADLTTWPTVAWPSLRKVQQPIFLARAEAVRLYCLREPLRAIQAATGIPISSIRRFYERCLQPHEDGRIQGMRALIPFEHVKPYRRLAKVGQPGSSGKAGAFALLLERYPELEAVVRSKSVTAFRPFSL